MRPFPPDVSVIVNDDGVTLMPLTKQGADALSKILELRAYKNAAGGFDIPDSAYDSLAVQLDKIVKTTH